MTGPSLGIIKVMKRVVTVGRPIFFIGCMGYESSIPSSYPLMYQVVIGLDMMWIYLETQLLSVPLAMVTWALTVGM